MSENQRITNNEKADVIDDEKGNRVIKGELEVFKGRGVSVNGEPLQLLFQDFDSAPVEITIKRT